MNETTWLQTVERRVRSFARRFGSVYAKNERQISASFEIGCFHALLDLYEKNFDLHLENLRNGEYRYLTSPNGNPDNFSFVRLAGKSGEYVLRQQVRVRSPVNADIQFTPDFVVYRKGVKIRRELDEDYAHGTRGLFFVKGEDLIAIHECKSMNPFPELLVSFLGMVVVAHPWAKRGDAMTRLSATGKHLAPSLFVGGTPRGLHKRMVAAITETYPVNVILGMHYSTWRLFGDEVSLNLIDDVEDNISRATRDRLFRPSGRKLILS